MKSKQELIEKWESAIEAAEFYGRGKEDRLIEYMRNFVDDLNRLDEPEVLSQEFIDKYKVDYDNWMPAVPIVHLQNLLVPKQEEVDQAYKDGYEKGKEHAGVKEAEETETVGRVFVDYLIASAKLKLALSMEVEELEE